MACKLIPFLVAGDPSLAETLTLARALLREGAGALEIGVPFSDPVADGPVIERAAARALANGVTLQDALNLIARLRVEFPAVPLILFTYANPLHAAGFAEYARAAAQAGVTSTLVVDLPLEEAGELIECHRANGVGNIFLVSPTTSAARAERIVAASTPYTYFVTRAGTTGTRDELPENLERDLRRITGPVMAGFGISSPAQAARLQNLVDAVVVGSAFVRLIEETPANLCEIRVRAFAREMIHALEGNP